MIKMMMPQIDLIKPSWSYQSSIDSPLDEVELHSLVIDYELANSELSSIFHSNICQEKLQIYPQVEVCFNPSSTGNQYFDEVEDYFDWMEYEGKSSSRECSVDCTSTSIMTTDSLINFDKIIFASEDMEIDEQLSISHLLKALVEAKENQYDDLANVISRRLADKACPKGSILNRLAYYLVKSSDADLDHYYLAQEAIKSYNLAFSLFYQLFPYGRLAHFVANSSILEALSKDTKTIHIVDFDMGEGVQWPPLIETISKKYPKIAIRIISLKKDYGDHVHPLQSFGNTKKRLCEHANSYSSGLALIIEEMGIEELATEMKKIGNSQGMENWVAFNCMKDLPHMGKQTSSRHAMDFLKLAQEYLRVYNCNRGIITMGNGNYIEEKKNEFFQGFGCIFEAELRRITALLESMELQMPLHLGEARVAMECLFVAPYLYSLDKSEVLESKNGFISNIGGWKMSEGIVTEAKELVGERDGIYCISTDGENQNEVILSYKGTPLLRVSSWGA